MGDETRSRLIFRMESELRLWPFAETNKFLSRFGHTASNSKYNTERTPRNMDNLIWYWNHEKLEEASDMELWILMTLCYAYRSDELEHSLRDAASSLDSISSSFEYVSRGLLRTIAMNDDEE